MGFLGRLLGMESDASKSAPAPVGDQQALERYRYMLRTAPPETLEQAYAEAFAGLAPEQRARVHAELSERAPDAERAAIAATTASDSAALARVATRAEIRQPGTMERALGPGAFGAGTSLLSSFAMGFVGSMVAQAFFSAVGGFGNDESAASIEDDSIDDGDPGDDGGDLGDDFDV